MVAVPAKLALAVIVLAADRAIVPPVSFGVPSSKVRPPAVCVPTTVTV